MGIRTQKPLPKGPAFGEALREGLRGPYGHRRSLRDRTGPSKRPPPPIRRTTHVAAADLVGDGSALAIDLAADGTADKANNGARGGADDSADATS